GARILTSNTFGLRTGGDWSRNLRAGLELCLSAVRESDDEVAAWMSVVPALVPVEIETLRFLATHALHWPGALLIETCTSLREAVAATQAARDLALELLAVTCHFRSDGHMPDGTTPEEAARTLTETGADMVGGNCG